MELVAYRLRPLSPLHLGAGRADDLTDVDELPRSDTLAAAIASLWGAVAGPGHPVSALADPPAFAVSSALPTLGDAASAEVLLPMPAGLIGVVRPELVAEKRVRRARFVARPLLDALLGVRKLPPWEVANGCLVEPSAARRFPDGLWHRDSRLRLTVDRLGDGPIEGLLYEFGSVRFAPELTLSVVTAFTREGVRRPFEAALRLLGEEGLGADRSAGYGRFEVVGAFAFASGSGEGARLSLSLLSPTRDEVESGLLEPPASYDLVVRGGWVTAPGVGSLRRKAVRMLAEGALLPDLGRTVYGRWPTVLEPDERLDLGHPVYRPGAAVTVPLSLPARGRGPS